MGLVIPVAVAAMLWSILFIAQVQQSIPISYHLFYLAGVVVVFSLLYLSIRRARARAVIQDTGLLVRNPYKTLLVPWADITELQLKQSGSREALCTAIRADGLEVPIWAIGLDGQSTRADERRTKSLVDALNLELATRRAAIAASPPADDDTTMAPEVDERS
jgi:hypothetical protein